jgi:hypothetical protein
MRRELALAALGLGLLAAPAQAQAQAQGGLAGCDVFIDKLRAAAGDLRIDFSHALIVSRARSDRDVFDVTTNSEVDGTLTCRKDSLLRFEARVAMPMTARQASQFEGLQAAALRAALGWEAGKAKSTARDMSADAREYLRASRERGDVYIAGKTEQHEPGGVGVGLIVTDNDSAFIIVGGQE